MTIYRPLAGILGTNVARLRVEQDISKTAFSQMVGISRPTLNKIEKGACDAKLSYVERLSDVLCTQPLELLTESNEYCELERYFYLMTR